MPAKAVTKFECDRCERVWYEDYKEQPVEETPKIVLLGSLIGEPVRYTCLCEGCVDTINNCLGTLTKDLKNKSPQRRAKKGDPADDAKSPKTSSAPSTAPAVKAAGSVAPPMTAVATSGAATPAPTPANAAGGHSTSKSPVLGRSG